MFDSQGMTRAQQNDAIAKVFAALLRESRLEVGLSQEQLALRAVVDRTFVSKIELAKTQLSLSVFFSLAYAVGKKPEDLIAEVQRRLTITSEVAERTGAV